MDYLEYIKLGFIREDFNDRIEFQQTGYFGFCLTKKINDKMSVEVCGGELDKPQLCINKHETGLVHRIAIPCEAVIDLFLPF